MRRAKRFANPTVSARLTNSHTACEGGPTLPPLLGGRDGRSGILLLLPPAAAAACGSLDFPSSHRRLLRSGPSSTGAAPCCCCCCQWSCCWLLLPLLLAAACREGWSNTAIAASRDGDTARGGVSHTALCAVTQYTTRCPIQSFVPIQLPAPWHSCLCLTQPLLPPHSPFYVLNPTPLAAPPLPHTHTHRERER
jgi:hypothetical protein